MSGPNIYSSPSGYVASGPGHMLATTGSIHSKSGNSGGSSGGAAISSAAASIADTIGRSGSQYADSIRDLLSLSRSNSAMSQANAEQMMDFQRESNNAAMSWSAQEAQKNRDWQERLSNTAHQREVKDLVAAGLNPVLSANNGAYTGSGATGQAFSSSGAMGQTDNSGTAALTSLMGNIINAASSQHIAEMTAENNRQIAQFNGMIDKYMSDNSLAGQRALAGASMYSADQSRIASAYAADQASTRQLRSDAAAHNRTMYQELQANKRNDLALQSNLMRSPMGSLWIAAEADKMFTEGVSNLVRGILK